MDVERTQITMLIWGVLGHTVDALPTFMGGCSSSGIESDYFAYSQYWNN